MTWLAVLAASAACYVLKLAGLLVPPRWTAGERRERAFALMPVALLAALVAVQTLGGRGGHLVVDARLVGLGVAAVALLLRAPFLVVVAAAAVATAAVRALT